MTWSSFLAVNEFIMDSSKAMRCIRVEVALKRIIESEGSYENYDSVLSFCFFFLIPSLSPFFFKYLRRKPLVRNREQ